MRIKSTNYILTTIIICLLMINVSAQSNIDSTGFPGDNFSLEGALELFKNAESPEAFEKALNKKDNNVNNLDLNEDGETDYIRVIDNMEDDVHAIVLQVPVNENESQDIAVIEIEKTGASSAILQILGDEEIYGEEVIIEPFGEVGESGGDGGPYENMNTLRIVINVWTWPSVKFVYAPAYRPYVSPWKWRVYPRWWKPWKPQSWRVHVNLRPHYRGQYHVVKTHRVVKAHKVYKPKRKTSVTVKKTTTTRTVVKKNGKVATKKTKTTTKKTGVKGKNGKVGVKTTKKTKVKKGKDGRAVKQTKTKKVKKKKGN